MGAAIAMAEAEAVSEAETVIKAEREEYQDPVVIPKEEDLKKERWETLPTEGHAVMTHRFMAGWTLLADFWQREQCYNTHSFFSQWEDKRVRCLRKKLLRQRWRL